MDNDFMGLLNDEFDYLIVESRENMQIKNAVFIANRLSYLYDNNILI